MTSPSPADNGWHKVRRLFDDVVLLAPADREAFLQAAGDDAAVVRRLIAVHDDYTGSGGRPGHAGVTSAITSMLFAAELSHDAVIGGFRIERMLGEGGMGRVYYATRTVGGVAQRVALKIVPFAVRDVRTVERLRRERAILATLDHPNIARLIDAGEIDDRPYFAMDYVDGVPITRYCDEHALDLRARLALFCDVCEAVAYAHRRLVLHRDIKPSNILVGADARVRLLDFGIGKSLDRARPLGETTVDGGFFSLSSAAPEQVLGRTTSVATDVYGLGCLLHELLVGRPPFDGSDTSREEIIRTIVEKPSALASAHARTPEERAALRGDLDTIVAKTLRKDPDDRYRSVDELVADVRNVLELRPIAARASERWYRFTMSLRRHRLTAIVAAALGAAVLTTTALSIVQSHRAAAERDVAVGALATAQTQRDHARRVTDFLVNSFQAADPVKARGRDLRADELLDSAVKSLEQDAAAQDPILRATVAQTLAHLFYTLDRLPDSLNQARVARTAFDRVSEPSTDLVVRQGLTDAEAAFVENRFDAATATSTTAIERLHGAPDAADADLLTLLWTVRCSAARSSGKIPTALACYREAIAALSNHAGRDVEAVDRLTQQLAAVLSDIGERAEARRLLERLLSEQRARANDDAPVMTQTLRLLSTVLVRTGQYDLAYTYAHEALLRHVTMYGEDNAEGARLLWTMGGALNMLGRFRESVQLYRRAEEIGARRMGRPSTFLSSVHWRLGNIYRFQLGELGQAEHVFRKAIEDTPPSARANRGNVLMALGEILIARGQLFEAKSYVSAGLAVYDEIDLKNLLAEFDLAYIAYRQYDLDSAKALITPRVVEEVRKIGDVEWTRERNVQLKEMAAFFGL